MFTYFTISANSHNLKISSQFKIPSSINTTQYIQTQDNLKEIPKYEKSTKPFHKKAFSFSPDLRGKKPIHLEKPEYPKKHLNYLSRNNQSSVPPRLKLAEIRPDFFRNEGMNLVVHQYALPQGLTAIRTPSPVNKVQNILEERINPTAQPIVRKGMPGWKISLRKLWRVDKKNNQLLNEFQRNHYK